MTINDAENEVFNLFAQEYETYIIKKYKNKINFNEVLKIKEEMEDFILEKIKDQEVRSNLLELLKKQENAFSEELCFWERQFYKKGKVDERNERDLL